MAKKYGKWTVQKSLDEGGQSVIFIATSEEDGNTSRALKRLKNRERLERFEREIEAVRGLSNRHIIKIIEYDIVGEAPFYVMPLYHAGNALKAGMHQATTSDKLRFFDEILEGMTAAHGKGIVHRDLKPENILVTGDRTPVIADFGICFVEDGERFTLTEEKVGNRDFSAPEVLEGRQEEVGTQSDVYSLGKLLHWLLSGKIVPRERQREPQYDLKKLLDDPQYEAITKLLDRMIVEQPEKRLADAASTLEEFRHVRQRMDLGANIPSADIEQNCVYCRDGVYRLDKSDVHQADGASESVEAVGITTFTPNRFRAMICDNCGNVQTFRIRSKSGGLNPNPWARK